MTLSFWISSPSFASMAWCRPSDQRRPGIVRPVNSSTMMIWRILESGGCGLGCGVSWVGSWWVGGWG